ncbi:hypothetical protein CYMTET_50530 [Cymbomonas tetramitiformis]|uniref:Enoyl reductase (ER) domain-containing protein n=1 Tax=Cymbomonas tetramitiformis TaxID=36881 RepID=A0AAE0BN29_9CHLO|nr:hypothetical protein CYMTET_50530 [Cymbomonas tetramitiformis]
MPKAVVCTALDSSFQSLELQEVPELPSLGEDEIAVSVLSCGIAFPDVLKVAGKYQVLSEPPFIPGSEICGIVTRVGEAVRNIQVGEKVFGILPSGGLAEEAVLSAGDVYKVPPGVDVNVAAGFELNYGTTFHGLKDIAQLQAGETLLVLGASGGVGLAAIDIGKALGATVIACASSGDKLEACRQAGADVCINYVEEDLRKSLKRVAPMGINVVYDPVGGKWSEPAIRSLAFGGRFVVVGFASGGDTPKDAIPKIPLNLALLGEKKILGCFWGEWRVRDQNKGNAKNIQNMLRMVQSGQLKPFVSKVYPFHSFREAFEDLTKRRVIGKICVAVASPKSKL